MESGTSLFDDLHNVQILLPACAWNAKNHCYELIVRTQLRSLSELPRDFNSPSTKSSFRRVPPTSTDEGTTDLPADADPFWDPQGLNAPNVSSAAAPVRRFRSCASSA